ncbi:MULTISPECIES: hypothetical protein [Chlamydia]|uniref:Inner membrane protein n=2 Tax=Chlamydia TaxID=810 RepID=A0ABN0MQ82_CHLPS|nr:MULTISPECIES: hypothetical protein [Chlamydia]AFS19266.1 putative inner membrane protein [Chlamydia psittaci 84/55]AFS22467.1 putative inner membrane protein [Chlamydia psittaci VS225]AGE74847.1 putative inner membrane protein [Chlamydia psittaci Mat116]EPJ16090.1 putative inner membrane protein [Chlamydia psittaci 02DC18]EPJ17264.1 putative inner membrane protein [Chlamydia psittaci 02DC22]EPJ19947.1 putative inner membrane protein [Chlamydia psittaci 02DC23]EPJ21045.1 putative inner mem
MVKQTCKLYLLQCLFYALYWLIYYCRKILQGIPNHPDEPLFQAFLSSFIELLSSLKHLPNPDSRQA